MGQMVIATQNEIGVTSSRRNNKDIPPFDIVKGISMEFREVHEVHLIGGLS